VDPLRRRGEFSSPGTLKTIQMSKLPACSSIKDGDIELPMVGSLYDFFAPRTKNITIWSIGFRHGVFEATIAESTGASIQIFDCNEISKDTYKVFARVMNEHETQEGDPSWAEALCSHWILPDSTTFRSYLPSPFTGTLVNEDVNIRLQEVNAEHVDICKVDCESYTTNYVYDFLNKGYRPGLLWIHWPAHPDESSQTMAAAGHVQNLGYRLLKSVGNYFVYIFLDNCIYEICSWNDVETNNPMLSEFQKQLLEGIKISE
jgi:hypothetical protein